MLTTIISVVQFTVFLSGWIEGKEDAKKDNPEHAKSLLLRAIILMLLSSIFITCIATYVNAYMFLSVFMMWANVWIIYNSALDASHNYNSNQPIDYVGKTAEWDKLMRRKKIGGKFFLFMKFVAMCISYGILRVLIEKCI